MSEVHFFEVQIPKEVRVRRFLCTLCIFFIFSAFVILPLVNSQGLRSRTSDISQKYRKISEILRFQGIALAGPQKRSKMLIFHARISEGIRNVGTKKKVFLFVGFRQKFRDFVKVLLSKKGFTP